MQLNLRIWRQKDTDTAGKFVTYQVDGVIPDMSFLEMLDVLNETLISRGEEPVAFEHDCREGICGSCGFLINGMAHGPRRHTTVCQLHMRFFQDGDSLTLEPWRARPPRARPSATTPTSATSPPGSGGARARPPRSTRSP